MYYLNLNNKNIDDYYQLLKVTDKCYQDTNREINIIEKNNRNKQLTKNKVKTGKVTKPSV